MHPWLTALEELMVTSSRRGERKGLLRRYSAVALLLLESDPASRGTDAKRGENNSRSQEWLSECGLGLWLCCWRSWGLTSCLLLAPELEHLMSAAESRVALLWDEGGKGFNQCSAVVARLENVCVIVKIQCMERPGGSRFPQ